jgi:hypothetical protein
MRKYFITNCIGELVGNKLGYTTYKGAHQQAEQIGTKAYNAIWEAFYQVEHTNPDQKLIYKIKLGV